VNATVAVPRAPRRDRLIAVVAVLAAAAIAFIAFFLPGSSETGGNATATVEAAGFTMSYPDGWHQVDRVPAGMQAVLRREDGKAFLVVREEGPLEGDLAQLTRGLDRELERRFEDYTKTQAQVVQLEAGRAFSYTYARTRAGTANGVVLVPAGDRSYAIDTVVLGGANDAARELGAIVRSFDLK
jgi:hypothetical protein